MKLSKQSLLATPGETDRQVLEKLEGQHSHDEYPADCANKNVSLQFRSEAKVLLICYARREIKKKSIQMLIRSVY